MIFKKLFAAAAIVLATVTGVHAATVTSVNDPAAWGMVDASQSLTLPSGGSWAAGPAPNAVVGSVPGQYRSPFQGAPGGLEATTSYWNVLAGQTATLLLDGPLTSLSFLWGSVDTYNYVRLYNGATLMDTITNLDLINPSNPVLATGAAFVTITGVTFDRVEFASGGNSFEFSNVAPVPLPAAGFLLIGALGGLAVVRRRKTA